MLNKIYNFSLGIFIGLFFISIFFGYKIEEKIKPKININLGPFVKDSCIIIFNKHIHHWLISLLILFVLRFSSFKIWDNLLKLCSNIVEIFL